MALKNKFIVTVFSFMVLWNTVYSKSTPFQLESNRTDIVDSQQPFPIDSGLIIYHRYNTYESGHSELFMYDFKNQVGPINISSDWKIYNKMNAHASPDGKYIVFMGINPSTRAVNWDVYLWQIGTEKHPLNLTNHFGVSSRDEDPKFIKGGKYIVFKQNQDIKIMNLDGKIQSTITNDGYASEESMPYAIGSQQSILYTKGAKANSDIYIFKKYSHLPLLNISGLSEYYPIAKDASTFYYTRWLSSAQDFHKDQIYLSDLYGNSGSLNINDTNSDNSDPYPVYNDLLFFSSNRNGETSKYDLFLGDSATGQVWDLSFLGLNSTINELGAIYVP